MTKDTRENIITAFFRLSEKYPDKSNFSFSEIAEEAGIARQTIYKNHFNSPNEIIEAIHHDIDERIMSKMLDFVPGSNESDNALFINYLASEIIPLIYENRIWLKYLYSTAADPNWELFLKKQYKSWISQNIQLSSKMGLSKEFTEELLVNYTLSIIKSWITQAIPESPEVFSKKFKLLCKLSIQDIIQNA